MVLDIWIEPLIPGSNSHGNSRWQEYPGREGVQSTLYRDTRLVNGVEMTSGTKYFVEHCRAAMGVSVVDEQRYVTCSVY